MWFTKEMVNIVLFVTYHMIVVCGINYCGFYFHPNAIQYPEREKIGLVDIYNTGIDRTKYYYKEFGVYKYVLFFKDGDIKNNVVTLDFN